MLNEHLSILHKSIPVDKVLGLLQTLGIDLEFQDEGVVIRHMRTRNIREVMNYESTITVEKLFDLIRDYCIIAEEDAGTASLINAENRAHRMIQRIDTELREIVLHFGTDPLT